MGGSTCLGGGSLVSTLCGTVAELMVMLGAVPRPGAGAEGSRGNGYRPGTGSLSSGGNGDTGEKS